MGGSEDTKRKLDYGVAVISIITMTINAILTAFIVWFSYRTDQTFAAQVKVLTTATSLLDTTAAQTNRQVELLDKATNLLSAANKQTERQVAILDSAKELFKMSYDQTSKQVVVLRTAEAALEQYTAAKARDDFNTYLDDADSYCCSMCAIGTPPNYMIVVPLDKAVQAETNAQPLLSAAEYNRLAMLGSAVWDVSKTDAYVEKALHAKSHSALDEFFSHLVRGHVYYSHLEKGAELSKVVKARTEFNSAVSALLSIQPTNDAIRRKIGEACAIMAAHEAFLGNKAETTQAFDTARTYWKNVPDSATLTSDWTSRVNAASAGARPEISCLFKAPVRVTPVTLSDPVPIIRVYQTPPAAPTAAAPAAPGR